jgi:hypothetical protein
MRQRAMGKYKVTSCTCFARAQYNAPLTKPVDLGAADRRRFAVTEASRQAALRQADLSHSFACSVTTAFRGWMRDVLYGMYASAKSRRLARKERRVVNCGRRRSRLWRKRASGGQALTA